MKLHKLIQRASAAAVASAMALSVSLPTLAAAPAGAELYSHPAEDIVSLSDGEPTGSAGEDEAQNTGITLNGESVLSNSTEAANIQIQYTKGAAASTLKILDAVTGNLSIKVDPDAAGDVDVVLAVPSGPAVSGKLTVNGAHDVTVTGETMAANEADINNISGDLTLTATGVDGRAVGYRGISFSVSPSGEERAIYIGGSRETEEFEDRIQPCWTTSWGPKEAYISIRKAPTYAVTVNGGELSNNYETYYKGETVRVKTSRPEKGLKFNRWFFPDDVETTDDPEDISFFFTMPDHPVEVTADWELYTGSEPTLFWEYYTYSDVFTPDNTPQHPAGMSNLIVSYDPASKTYTADFKDALYGSTSFKCSESPNIHVKGELGNSVHISGANNVTIDADTQKLHTGLDVNCAGTLTLKNNTGTSPLKVDLTYTQAEGVGYTVVLDGETLEEVPTYEHTTVSLNKSLTIIPDIADPIPPEEPGEDSDGSDAVGTLVAAAVAGAAVFGGYTIVTELMLQNLLPEGAAIPQNQAQLAKLIWQTAGSPEPANASAFAQLADPETAKAAQWCVEQGYLDADFAPDKWTPKFKVIQIWNRAFPKQ